MKIINKDEFLKLPQGVLYCVNDKPNYVGFRDIRIKGETCAHHTKACDWYEIRLTEYEHNDSNELVDRHCEMFENGKSYPIGIYSSRNGLYEEENTFLVYEKADIQILITELQKCIGLDEC